MANYCSNTVAFEGSLEAMIQIDRLFKAMAEKGQRENKGQLPDFVAADSGYFIDIYWNEGDSGIFQYETRWSPNTEVLQEIARHYSLDFAHDYEEMGNGIYGRVTYVGGILIDTCLEDVDFDSFTYDDDEDTYHFEGKEYESDCEILETLLERKISAL